MKTEARNHYIRKILITAAAAALFGLSFVPQTFAEENGDTTRFVTGTKINGVGVGALTVDEARDRIEGFYAGEYKLTVKEKGGKQEVIAGADIGYRVAADSGLQPILDSQNASGRMAGPSADNTHTINMAVTYSAEALDAKVKGLSIVSGTGIKATADAHVSAYEEGKSFTIVPAVQGNDVDVEKLGALITEAVKAGQALVDAEAGGCYYQVKVWETDEGLKNLCDAMNRYREMSVNYVFGEARESLSGDAICSWITGSQDGKPAFDQEKLTAYVAALAAKYDTAGSARPFRTASGVDVALTGPYGWKMDVAGEVQALNALLQTGPADGPLDREPVYASAAASRTGADWGTTYAEVDLSGQHVYMFQDGALVWEAPCVTGNLAKNYNTPAGIYSLAYKEKDRILRGAKKADGSYEYESHVDYWMPFNGGIGFHDAAWRGDFGGAIYKTSGSHGCVNLPPKKAAVLYDLIYKGMPVLCYE